MSYSFNGTNNRLTCSAPVTATPFTVCFWFKKGDAAVTDTIFSLGQDGVTTDYFRVNSAATKVAAAVNGGGSTGTASQTGTSSDTASWHHVCAVFTSSTSRTIYWDGGQNATDATSATPATPNELQIGET